MKKANNSKKKNRTGRKPLPRMPKDNTTTLAIKCYEEQCVGGIEKTLIRIKQMDRNRYECYAIVHDKTGIKRHLHIAIRVRGKKTTDSEKVSRILKDFGINFREEDTVLMHHHGLETLASWTGFFIYLCHEDETSKSLGKVTYDIYEFVTNLEPGVFRSMMQGKLPKKRITAKEQFGMDCDEAKLAGYDLWNWERWKKYKRKDYVDYRGNKMDLIREFFEEGRNEKIGTYISRIIIVINITGNESYDFSDVKQIAKTALTDMSLSVDENDDKDSVDAHIIHAKKKDVAEVSVVTGEIMKNKMNEFLEYSNVIEKEIDPKSRYVEETGKIIAWKYKIFIIDDKSVEDLLNATKNMAYYYCLIDTDETKLCCKDIKDKDKDTVEVKLDRKALYKDFLTAFNMRLASYVREPEKKELPPQIVDYSDILS